MPAKHYRIIVKSTTYQAQVEEQGPSTALVSIGTRKLKVELGAAAPSIAPAAEQPAASPNAVAAHLPGKVEEVLAAPGSQVKAGDELVVMNSMKMRVAINAPRNAAIESVLVRPGDVVTSGQTLLELRPA